MAPNPTGLGDLHGPKPQKFIGVTGASGYGPYSGGHDHDARLMQNLMFFLRFYEPGAARGIWQLGLGSCHIPFACTSGNRLVTVSHLR